MSGILDRWELAIDSIERAFGICLTIHDIRGIMSDKEGVILIKERNLHPHDICQRKVKNAYGKNNCHSHCMHSIHALAGEKKEAFVTSCWKGVKEVVVPIICRDQVVMILYAGAFKSDCIIPDATVLPARLLEIQKNLPELTEEKERALIATLTTLGQGLFAEAENYLGLSAVDPDRKVMIRRFIFDHAHELISLEDLAEYLYLSASRTGHLVSELFGCTFKQLLNKERITRAKLLLENSSLQVKGVANRVGIPNFQYFNRLFKAETGMTPLSYRKKRLSENV